MIICFFFLTLSSHSHTYSIVLLSLEITIPISLFITPYRNRSVHYHIKKNLSNEYDAFNICQDFVVTGTSLFSCVIVWVTFGQRFLITLAIRDASKIVLHFYWKKSCLEIEIYYSSDLPNRTDGTKTI